MRTYEPTIDYGEQRFVANVISIAEELIAFGDLLPQDGKELRFGTPIHSLLIHLAGENTLFELNDQGNTRDRRDVESVELTPTSLRIVFRAGYGPMSGRVPLAESIEVFESDDHEPQELRSVLAMMNTTPAELKQLTTLLEANGLLASRSR